MKAPPSHAYKTMHSNISQPHVESPLRKASFPVSDATSAVQEVRSHDSSRRPNDQALESETEDDDVYTAHARKQKGKYSENGYTSSSEDLGSNRGGSNEISGHGEESTYGVPILAADEVARTPGVEHLQAAITPSQSRRGSSYYTGDQDFPGLSKTGSRSGSASNSRPSSRPGSVHGHPLHRFSTHEDERDNMHTPLEDVDEYEPLFPDEEGNKKPATAAQRLKLREQMKRFPSQDIWEDTPNSLQLQATVDTPEPVAAQADPTMKAPSAVFETPEQEAARKGEVNEEDKAKLIPREERLAKSNFKPHLREEMHRPGLKQRFPSRDIWEDSPDSAELTTTVGGDATTDVKSATDAGLEAGAVVQTSGSPKDDILAGDQARDGAMAGVPSIPPRPNKSKISPTDVSHQPPIPARPPKRLHQVPPADAKVPAAPSKLDQITSPTEAQEVSPTEGRKGPALPERAKPQIPARPARPPPQDASEGTPLSQVTSASSMGSEGSDTGVRSPPNVPKAKPAVPARPAGSKIAALQGGFLADLNSRLRFGPQGSKPQEKEPEPEEVKAPLADARKGRAKGPARRKPATPATEAATEAKPTAPKWTVCQPTTVWQTDAKGYVRVTSPAPAPSTVASPSTRAEPLKAEPTSEAAPEKEDIQPAKIAVEESLQASNPLHQELKAATPETPVTDFATPALEVERNPLSIAPNTPVVDSPAKAATPAQADSESQTGEQNITVMPGTEAEEKMTATLGGRAQADGEETVNVLQKE